MLLSYSVQRNNFSFNNRLLEEFHLPGPLTFGAGFPGVFAGSVNPPPLIGGGGKLDG
jgi:hypothetical protein